MPFNLNFEPGKTAAATIKKEAEEKSPGMEIFPGDLRTFAFL